MGRDLMDDELYRLAEEVGNALKQHGMMLATAESCTGGWVGEVVTAVPGSSEVCPASLPSCCGRV